VGRSSCACELSILRSGGGVSFELATKSPSAVRQAVQFRSTTTHLPPRFMPASSGASGELWLEDLGSTNGTWVNDERLDNPVRLRRGDRVKVGSTILEVAR